jgi:hypothetical protein
VLWRKRNNWHKGNLELNNLVVLAMTVKAGSVAVVLMRLYENWRIR